MTGVEALIELLKGKKIRRHMWDDVNYWRLKDNKLCTQDGHIFNMTFNELIMGNDWELYENKLDFFEALEKMKDGYRVLNINENIVYYIENGQLQNINDKNCILDLNFNLKIWELIED